MPSFEDVHQAEREMLVAEVRSGAQRGRAMAAAAAPQPPEKLIGLALSGGGIRSATFNLGVLQGLAKANLLEKIHYLSTVSGGGYIGGWLVRWIKEAESVKKVQEKLGHFVPHREKGLFLVEPKEIGFLRDYSNYLTPRKGIFGADTWAAIAAYIRNVILNQTILIAFLGAILFMPWILGRLGAFLEYHYFRTASVPLALASYVVLIFVLTIASYLVAGCPVSDHKPPPIAQQKYVVLLIVLPLFVSAILLSGSLWLNTTIYPWYAWALTGSIVFGVAHIFGLLGRVVYLKGKDKNLTTYQVIGIPFCAFVAGLVGGLLLLSLQWLFDFWRLSTGSAGLWHATSWGPPLIVALFLATGTLHIGLLKAQIPNYEQEWWARLAGLLNLCSLAWAALFGLAIFVPLALIVFSKWIAAKVALLVGWAGSTLWGVLAGRSAKSSGTPEDTGKPGKLMLVAPYVFIAGLIVLLSIGGHWLAFHLPSFASESRIHVTSMPHMHEAIGNLTPAEQYWQEVRSLRVFNLLFGLVSLLACAVLLAWRVDINTFSMNLLYRNRVIRCYLGAARPESKRQPNPFTGFDQSDEEFLTEFDREKGYDGPYPLICAALNVTHGERLAWQERRAESFVFSPKFCGYEYPSMHTDDQQRACAYYDTGQYAYPKREQNPSHKDHGGPRLGTSISISGAAASPNMGFHTSPPLAFLMTVFNVRLGWWLANPRYDNDAFLLKPEGGPKFSLLYLLKELFASTTDLSKYVYLSDGGHFENLAVYELIRRRCAFIIASDADEDTSMQFGDLGNAIRKCRSDFGVEIEVDTTAIKPDEKTRFAEAHGVLGTIQYPVGPNGEPAFEGHILYLKATMTKNVARDVLAYRDMHKAFPDDPTANQWFDESQFESYRNLGFHTFNSLEETARHKIVPPQLPNIYAFNAWDILNAG